MDIENTPLEEPVVLPEQVTEGNNPSGPSDNMKALRQEFEERLLMANLKAEAIKAGMIDLDGLRLVDLAGIKLDASDNIIDGPVVMARLRRSKPWLFGSSSSSSGATVPASGPVRTKMAMDMSADEYAAARAALTRHQF